MIVNKKDDNRDKPKIKSYVATRLICMYCIDQFSRQFPSAFAEIKPQKQRRSRKNMIIIIIIALLFMAAIAIGSASVGTFFILLIYHYLQV